jgi:hypothetical protein
MKMLHIEKKGKMLDALENYYIYMITKQGIQISETLANGNNPIYEFLAKRKHLKPNPL